MSTVDGSKRILTAGASFQAGNWASGSGGASLDFQAVASFSRGLDLQLGAQALVSLDGAIRQYLAADISGQAHAAAQVQAQVQVPLDLFGEAGLAIRVQAAAEAAAGVTLAIGLSVGDFLALAGSDPRMRGVPIELLKAFLAEFSIQGGVMAKAAVAAMAYANLALTGRLVPSGSDKPGFTVAAEAGAGLEAGAGFRVLARFGVDDPRRWLRRSIDIAVDNSIQTLRPSLPPAAAVVLTQSRVPMKIALRTAYEVGEALAANQGNFSSGDGPKLALRFVQVALEEVQRHVFEFAVSFAAGHIREELRTLASASRQRWQNARPLRQSLANRLANLPEYPFEADQTTLDYWLGLFDDVVQLVIAIAPSGTVAPGILRPVAVAWSAVQLLSISLRRISSAQARASLIGMQPASATAAFDGPLPDPADAIRKHINAVLNRNPNSAIKQAHAARFLEKYLMEVADQLDPSVSNALEFISGGGTSFSNALRVVLENAGAFEPGANGSPSPYASLQVIRQVLQQFLAGPVETVLRPALLEITGEARDTSLFVDEVLLAPLPRITGELLVRLVEWSRQNNVTQRALREFCSSVVLNLAGRSLVVCSDVLLTKALEPLETELRNLAAHTGDTNGIASVISQLTGLDRDFVTEVVSETLLVASDTFVPLPPERRQRIRELLYEILGTTTGISLDDLARPDFVPNLDAAKELVLLLGEEIAGNFVRFFQSWLRRVGTLILEELADLIQSLQDSVEEWAAELVQLVSELAQRLSQLAAEIEALGRELEESADRMLDRLSSLLKQLDNHSGSKAALRSVVKDLAVREALSALRSSGAYQNLPRELRSAARSELRKQTSAFLDTGLFDLVVQAISSVAGETAEMLDDIRAIEPGDDIEQAVMDLFLDRLEDAIRGAFGGENPRSELAIDFSEVHISLGRVEIPITQVVSVIRRKVGELEGIRIRVRKVAEALADVFEKEGALRASEAESAAVSKELARGEGHLAQTRRGPPRVEFLTPAPGSVVRGVVPVEIVLRNVSREIMETIPPAQRRVFLWVNLHPVELNEVEVEDLTSVASIPHPLAGIRNGLHDRGYERARYRDASASMVPRGRIDGVYRAWAVLAGKRLNLVVGKAGGRALPPVSGAIPASSIGRPIRPREAAAIRENGEGGISIRLRIPETLLEKGANTITIAVMPGSSTQRVEQVATFLWQPQADMGREGVPMPAKPAWNLDHLPEFAHEAAATGGRFLAEAGPPLLKTVSASDGRPRSWASSKDKKGRAFHAGFPTAQARKEAVESTAGRLKEVMKLSTVEVSKLREAVQDGKFHPVLPMKGSAKNLGEEVGNA